MFIMIYADMKDPNENFVIQTFKGGVISEYVHYVLCHRDITSMHELVTRARALAKVEEMRNNHLG